jgi:hypothetical protein
LVVITAVVGVFVSEICTSAFCTAIAADSEHTRGDREYCVGVSPRARHDANGEEGNKKEQLQQQRPRRRNPSALEAAGEQRVRKKISMKTGTDRM